MDGWSLARMPNDKFCDRISIGSGGHMRPGSGYMTYRGNPKDILAHLEEAVTRLRLLSDLAEVRSVDNS